MAASGMSLPHRPSPSQPPPVHQPTQPNDRTSTTSIAASTLCARRATGPTLLQVEVEFTSQARPNVTDDSCSNPSPALEEDNDMGLRA